MKKHKLIYVIAGKEISSVNSECEKLLEKLLEPHQRTTGLFNVDPARVPVSEVLDELRTAPFLTKERVVLIKNADDFVSRNRQLLERYFDNPCPTGILILAVKSWPGSTKLAKKLSKAGKLIKIAQVKQWQLPSHLIEYAGSAHGKSLARTAAELLIELTGDNLARLYGEIDKLALFVNTEKIITARHIELLIGHNRLFNVFAIIDAIVTGNISKALGRLRSMFAEDKSTEYTAIGAFAFHFRKVFRAKVLLGRGLNTSEVAIKLKIWSNKEAFFAQLQKMSLEQLGSILQRLAAIDYAIKTGQTKAEIAIEQLVLGLAGGRFVG